MVESLLARATDLQIAVSLYALFGALGIALSALSYQLLGKRLDDDHRDLAENIEKSIFAFSIFVLALTLTDVRSNFAKASDNVIAEAFTIRQLANDIDLDVEGERARERNTLIGYAKAVVDDEWKTLAQAEPKLSLAAGAYLADLRAHLREAIVRYGRGPAVERARKAIDDLENQRHLRLQAATASSPVAFWVFTLILMLVGAVMTGRGPVEWRRALVLLQYFGALGLIVALILILDRPFRGETSVSSAPIRSVITQLEAVNSGTEVH